MLCKLVFRLLLILFAGSTNIWQCFKMAASEGNADAGAEKVGFHLIFELDV